MDDRYFAVKAAKDRFLQININRTESLKFEMKFLQLQAAIIHDPPTVQGGDPNFDGLTLLVEELAEEPYRHSYSDSLYKHLNKMIAVLNGKTEQSATLS